MCASSPTDARRCAWAFLLSAALLSATVGCATPVLRPERLDQGYILYLPGVENRSWKTANLLAGLRDANLPYAVEVNYWGVPLFGTFPNLRDYALNRQRAARMAESLTMRARGHPDLPIVIIGYSGGGGMAVFVAEALPEDLRLERIILIAPALSPTYDLSVALARTRSGILSYYSNRDRFMLGWGTRTFGTMDRVRCDAAGRVGFRDCAGALVEGPGLQQVAWCEEWLQLGNDGTHDGWMARAWAREVLARQLAPVTESAFK